MTTKERLGDYFENGIVAGVALVAVVAACLILYAFYRWVLVPFSSEIIRIIIGTSALLAAILLLGFITTEVGRRVEDWIDE